MKPAVVALGAIPPDVLINCAKPNANYCMSGDIILRCDARSLGTRGRCSDNVAGYAPAGGIASCYQSSEEAGDAACQKNCVVYAAQPFTLPADKCTPSPTSGITPSHSAGATAPGKTSAMTDSSSAAAVPSSSRSEPDGCPVPTATRATTTAAAASTTATSAVPTAAAAAIGANQAAGVVLAVAAVLVSALFL
ncbi:hypothetical protein E4U41_003182 [Claviceps citrina]|nr:hypothetical protein E4U41_003182 [Claviceps citrina]